MNAITEAPLPTPTTMQSMPPARRPRRKLWVRALIGAAALGLVTITASWWFTEGRWIESTDDAYVHGDIAGLSPRIEGTISAIRVADNQRVQAGDPLIELDPSDWQARLDQAKASEAEASAAVATARSQLAWQQSNIEAAQAAIAQAEAEQIRAGADAARSARLTEQGWASRQSNDQALADKRKSAAALVAAQ